MAFHMPGHKAGKWDITELSYSDNLCAPRGCIAEAEKEIAEILGAKKSFLLTDGSTSGVLSMLYAAKALGVQKIALAQDAHKSFFHGCEILGLTPLVYPTKKEKSIPFPYTMSELTERFSCVLTEADALFITSPNYYGGVADLKGLRAYCNERKKLLLIDGAHGGHLHFERNLYAGEYADMWVDGVHKSLPALTQGAVVSAKAGCVEALRRGVEIFRTSSPSYPIMASVEYAVKCPRNLRLEKEVAALRKRLSAGRVLPSEDWTKLCVLFGKGAFAANEALERMGIYPEFCDGEVIEFYLSPHTKIREIRRLERALNALFQRYPCEGNNYVERVPAPLVSLQNQRTEWIALAGAAGRICAGDCGMFPPCTPLIVAGERVSEEKIKLLQAAANVYGLVDGKIIVLTEEKR